MGKILIYKKLNERISDLEREEIIEKALKIQIYKREGNNKKIMQLDRSNILNRIHLSGKTKRMIFSYINDNIKIYTIFSATEEKEKARLYDKACANEKHRKNKDFIDITPEKKTEISQKELKKINSLLKNSALMLIPETGKVNLNDLFLNLRIAKWVKKYPNLKKIFDACKNDKRSTSKFLAALDILRKHKSEISELNRSLVRDMSKNKLKKVIKEITQSV